MSIVANENVGLPQKWPRVVARDRRSQEYQKRMSTKDRGTQESIGPMDTLDALLLEAVETARMQDYDPDEDDE